MMEARSLPAPRLGGDEDRYAAARAALREHLVRRTLIESYHSFARHGKPYPFPAPEALRPGGSAAGLEHPLHRAALVVMVDGAVPPALAKHVRMRRSNEISGANLARLAPGIAAGGVEPAGLGLGAPGFGPLLARLLLLDYALVVQRCDGGGVEGGFALTHMHVKIERLTDNAIRQFAKDLGLIERRLFERGPAFAEALEAKYFEYFGFSANASGRKSAAAMIAQLLSGRAGRFAVFVSCQDEGRLMVLDETPLITHYALRPSSEAERARLGGPGALDQAAYVLEGPAGPPAVLTRVRYRRREPPIAGLDPEDALEHVRVEIADEAIVSLPGHRAPALAVRWAEAA